MDPLSISASVITLIQATNGVIHLCFDYASTVKGASRAISGLLEEIKSLRNILESLERLLASSDNPDTAPAIELKEVAALCNRESQKSWSFLTRSYVCQIGQVRMDRDVKL